MSEGGITYHRVSEACAIASHLNALHKVEKISIAKTMSHLLLFFYSGKDRKDYEKKKVFCNFFYQKEKQMLFLKKKL